MLVTREFTGPNGERLALYLDKDGGHWCRSTSKDIKWFVDQYIYPPNTYFGGNLSDTGVAIAVDSGAGDAYVVGATQSTVDVPNKIGWGWEPAPSGEGPAMYWYGWSANVVVVAAILGLLATLLPSNVVKKIPLTLTWLLPIVSLPIVIYTLIPLLTHK